MGKRRKPRIAISYDFDGTLSPSNMQEYDFIPQLGIPPKKFWKMVKDVAEEQNADEILAYMCLMLREANHKQVKMSRKSVVEYGKSVELYEGVREWFKRIDEYGKQRDVIIEHYIVSSGLKEMIEGSTISRCFKRIFASSFMYSQDNIANWPALAINYTTKTQFLFRINKGTLDVYDNSMINEYVPDAKRAVPFSNMIYIGDGSTDVPCMRLVTDKGGHSIAVYKPNSSKQTANKLKKQGRVNFVCPADYSDGKDLDSTVKAIIDKIISDTTLNRLAQGK